MDVLSSTAVSSDCHKTKQVNTIAMITFWSQFSVYVLNTVLVLFLTRSVLLNGLGYTSGKAYLFIGVSQAMGYIMPLLGGQMADKVLGLTRSILIGSLLLAVAYLLVMLSGLLVPSLGDKAFIAAYALIPAMNSLLMGTASAVVAKVYAKDLVKAKSGMTLFYMSINVGALAATIIAPQLLESRYGPLSVFAVVFIGKSLCALNYLYRYNIYEDISTAVDQEKFNMKKVLQLLSYLFSIYCATLYIYFHTEIASYLIGIGALGGLLAFFIKTMSLKGADRTKQLIAVLLILEAVIFFVLYNQMNTTIIMFAKDYSDLKMFGLNVSPANYQMLNPIMIIVLSLFLPKFYKRFQKFTIPYQFAAGTALGGLALLIMYMGCLNNPTGHISGNYLVLTYAVMTLAELWVSAVGLSMIGLYCSHHMLGFAMGIWYLSNSLSNVVSGQLAQLVALPENMNNVEFGIRTYQHYYFDMGAVAIFIGIVMWFVAIYLNKRMNRQGVKLA